MIILEADRFERAADCIDCALTNFCACSWSRAWSRVRVRTRNEHRGERADTDRPTSRLVRV